MVVPGKWFVWVKTLNKMKNQPNKLQKVIYKLSVEKGFPYIKLTFSEFQQVLKEAHKRVYQS